MKGKICPQSCKYLHFCVLLKHLRKLLFPLLLHFGCFLVKSGLSVEIYGFLNPCFRNRETNFCLNHWQFHAWRVGDDHYYHPQGRQRYVARRAGVLHLLSESKNSDGDGHRTARSVSSKHHFLTSSLYGKDSVQSSSCCLEVDAF